MAREVFQKTNLYTLRLLFLRLRYIIKRGSTTLFCCKMLPAFESDGRCLNGFCATPGNLPAQIYLAGRKYICNLPAGSFQILCITGNQYPYFLRLSTRNSAEKTTPMTSATTMDHQIPSIPQRRGSSSTAAT